jgi:hypothetical protein
MALLFTSPTESWVRGLKPHQPSHVQNLLRPLLSNNAVLDASDTGTGKTFTTLAICRILGASPRVIAPKATRNDWEAASALMGVPIEFWNYEKARLSKNGLGHEQKWGKGSMWVWDKPCEIMVFDECHRCGGSTTLNGKMLRSARKAANYVICLSATVADNPLQMKNVGVALNLFTNQFYRTWLFRHGVKPHWAGGWCFAEDRQEQRAAMEKLHTEIFPRKGARMQRKLIPGFPETQIDIKLVDASDNRTAAKLAKELQEARDNDFATYQYCRMGLENLLIEPALDLIEDAVEGGGVVVFTNYINVLDDLVTRLQRRKLSVGSIDGRQTGESGEAERTKFKKAFQANRLNVLVVNVQAGGAGLSLHDPTGQVERTTFIFSTDSGRQLKQVLGRVHRVGGAFSRQFLMGFKNTVQEEILLTSRQKIANIDALNGEQLDSLKF